MWCSAINGIRLPLAGRHKPFESIIIPHFQMRIADNLGARLFILNTNIRRHIIIIIILALDIFGSLDRHCRGPKRERKANINSNWLNWSSMGRPSLALNRKCTTETAAGHVTIDASLRYVFVVFAKKLQAEHLYGQRERNKKWRRNSASCPRRHNIKFRSNKSNWNAHETNCVLEYNEWTVARARPLARSCQLK